METLQRGVISQRARGALRINNYLPYDDYFITDVETDDCIIMLHDTAIKFKKMYTTPGILGRELYEHFGNNPRNKEILDRNLRRRHDVRTVEELNQSCKLINETLNVLLTDFQNIVTD